MLEGRKVGPIGPIPALVMIVGEAPGEEEVLRGEPFVGTSGWELNKMLREVGLDRASCFITNVCKVRPPGNRIEKWFWEKAPKNAPADFVRCRGRLVHPAIAEGVADLEKEISLVQPDIIIALGNTPLWAITGNLGITKWRGSMLTVGGRKVLPTYHPTAVLRQWEYRRVAVHDLRRAAKAIGQPWPQPEWRFTVEPSFSQAQGILEDLLKRCSICPTHLSVDIETRQWQIACLGIAWTKHDAICIPFRLLSGASYWSLEEEAAITFLLYRLLTHPNARVLGQNFIYDAQYIFRSWHFIPRFARDTMLAHHVLFPALPKGLDFICSMHNEQYVYWKDDGKTLAEDGDERKHWEYNCEDCVRTLEADESLQYCVDATGLRYPHDFQMSLFRPVLKMMNRGMAVDDHQRAVLQRQLRLAKAEEGRWIETAVGEPLNINSPKQLADFFYRQMALPKQFAKKSAAANPGPSTNSESLEKLLKKQPLLAPIITRIEAMRSMVVFASNFLEDKSDVDGRMHCGFNIAGTKTYRFSSSQNAFGSGLNGQNIPKGDEE